MNKGITYWLRWLALLPGAFLAGSISNLVIAGLLNSIWPNAQLSNNGQMVVQSLLYFVWSFVYILAAYYIAPTNKPKAVYVLFALEVVLQIFSAIITLPDNERVSLAPSSTRIAEAIIAIAGGLVAIYYLKTKKFIIAQT